MLRRPGSRFISINLATSTHYVCHVGFVYWKKVGRCGVVLEREHWQGWQNAVERGMRVQLGGRGMRP